MTSSEVLRANALPEALPKWSMLGVLGLQAGGAAIAVAFRGELITLAVVLALGLLALMVRFPLLWLAAVVLSLIPLYLLQGPTVEVGEVVLVLALLAMLGVWLVWQAAVVRARLTEHWGDVLLLLFLGLSALNLPIALLNEVPLEEWLRRWLPMWLVAYYLPLRSYVRRPQQLGLLLGLLLLVGLVIAVFTVERYRSGVAIAEYAYQLRAPLARMQGEHLLAFALVGCLLGAAFLRSVLWRLLLLGCAIVLGGAVVVTFSRTAWVSALLGLSLALLLVTWRQRMRLLLAGGILVVASGVILGALFPQVAPVLFRLLEQRFVSIVYGRQDLALRGRFFQLEGAVQRIKQYPMGGHGLGKTYPYYEVGLYRHIHYTYIHNAYLATAYRYGIPMAVLLLVAIGAHGLHALRRMLRLPLESFQRMVAALGVAGIAGAMLSLMMTENPFDMRLTTVVLTWSLAMANIRLDG